MVLTTNSGISNNDRWIIKVSLNSGQQRVHNVWANSMLAASFGAIIPNI